MSWASPASWRNQGGGTPVPYPPCPRPHPATSWWSAPAPPGLFASLIAAREGARVTLVSARPLAETASYWAQGGLAAALAEDDTPELHLEDTLIAGRDLVRRSAAEVLCAEAPARFADLEGYGVRFDADRHGAARAGAGGRAPQAPRRPRRRQRDRPPDPAPALGRGRRRRRDRRAGGEPRPRAPAGRRRPDPRGRHRRRPDDRRARGDPRLAAAPPRSGAAPRTRPARTARG